MINLIIALLGLFCIFCAFMNYDWFFEHYRTKPLVWLFSRTGARLFYAILGLIALFIAITLRID